jgi:hypothetical protein
VAVDLRRSSPTWRPRTRPAPLWPRPKPSHEDSAYRLRRPTRPRTQALAGLPRRSSGLRPQPTRPRDPDALRAAVRAIAPDGDRQRRRLHRGGQGRIRTDLAQAINAIAPGILAEEARRLDALLIHYSTDYVFDGTKSGAYTRERRPAPLSAYGRSKLDGEQAIAAAGARHLVLRTSWVYGLHGANFMKTMLRLGPRARRTARRRRPGRRTDLDPPPGRRHCPDPRPQGNARRSCTTLPPPARRTGTAMPKRSSPRRCRAACSKNRPKVHRITSADYPAAGTAPRQLAARLHAFPRDLASPCPTGASASPTASPTHASESLHADEKHGRNPRLRRILLPCPQGTGTGARAPRHVHPHRLAGPHHPGSHRQLRRRSTRRPCEKPPCPAASRRLDHRHRRRPRHPGRPPSRRKRSRWSCWPSPGSTPAASSTRAPAIRPMPFPAACTASASR